MKLAIVGTSHVATLREAVNAGALPPGFTAPFWLSVSAPVLSKQNSLGWPGAPGIMQYDFPMARNYLSRLTGNADPVFDPAEYDVILLSDFFFCYDFAWIFRDKGNPLLSVGGVPVSDTAYMRILSDSLGSSDYTGHPAVGTVPRNSVLPLFSAMRQRAPKARIFLTPRPMQLSHNRTRLGIGLNGAEMQRMARLCEKVSAALLSPIGIAFLPRLSPQIDPATGMTPDHYSKGPLQNDPERLDEHMTGAFGTEILQQMTAALERGSDG